MCCHLWKERNSLCFQNQLGNPIDVWLASWNDFSEFQGVNASDSVGVPRQQLRGRLEDWIPPITGVVKICCDASFDPSSKRAWIAAVFRDSSRNIVGGANDCVMAASVCIGSYGLQIGCFCCS
ncbi:hypothetical protein V6N13_038022 [Hibiscus sabdariffa]